MPTLNELSPSQIREALKLSEQIESLRARLQSILGSGRSTRTAPSAKRSTNGRVAGKRTMSPEGRERIAAAARARWAKVRGGKAAPAKVTAAAKSKPGKKGGLTPEGRARLAASMKARWAARKKGGPAPNAPAA